MDIPVYGGLVVLYQAVICREIPSQRFAACHPPPPPIVKETKAVMVCCCKSIHGWLSMCDHFAQGLISKPRRVVGSCWSFNVGVRYGDCP